MGAIYNGGKYYSGSPTSISELNNDSNFAPINDTQSSSSATFSSEKMINTFTTLTVATEAPSSVGVNELVVVVEE